MSSEPVIKAALKVRYPLPEWAVYFNVANGTGGNQRRWADAVAFNCYPSRGLGIIGFEIKVSRSDWLRELAQPDKSVAVQQYCDYWYVVAPPDIVRAGELPPTWGLIEHKGERLYTKTEAPKLTDTKPISRAFMVAVLRNAAQADESQINVLIEARIKSIREKNQEHINSEVQHRTRRHDNVVKKLEEIKASTGIDLTDWSPNEQNIAAIKFSLAAELGSRYRSISKVCGMLDAASKQLRKGFEEAGISPGENDVLEI